MIPVAVCLRHPQGAFWGGETWHSASVEEVCEAQFSRSGFGSSGHGSNTLSLVRWVSRFGCLADRLPFNPLFNDNDVDRFYPHLQVRSSPISDFIREFSSVIGIETRLEVNIRTHECVIMEEFPLFTCSSLHRQTGKDGCAIISLVGCPELRA